MKNSDGGGFLLFALLLAVWFWPASDIKEIKVYFSFCSDTGHYNVYSCPSKISLSETNYKVLIREQKVIENSYFATRHENCEVFDEDNWTCQKGDTRFGIEDGDYIDLADTGTLDKDGKKSFIPMFLQISRFEYNLRLITEFFSDFLG